MNTPFMIGGHHVGILFTEPTKDPNNPLVDETKWMCVVYNNGKWYMYLGFFTAGSVGELRTSRDGIHWSAPTTILPRGGAGAWDEKAIEIHSVIKRGGTWIMYYCGLNAAGKWAVGAATAKDLAGPWTKYAGNPILMAGGGWEGTILADPHAIIYRGKVFLYYSCFKNGTWDSGVATSLDGLTGWVKHPANPALSHGRRGTWDSAQATISGVLGIDGGVIVSYQGTNAEGISRIGIAQSEDGYAFSKYPNNPVVPLGLAGTWDGNEHFHQDLLIAEGRVYMYYAARSDPPPGSIRIGRCWVELAK